MSALEEVKKLLGAVSSQDIIFKQHFHDRAKDRPLSESMVRDCLMNMEKLFNVEEQLSLRPEERKFKLWFRLSSKYNLVLVAALSGKSLYIITGWNSERKWQKAR